MEPTAERYQAATQVNVVSPEIVFHSGFSVHNGVRIRENDPEALGRLAQYVVHASFAAEKIRYVEASGSVIYKSKMHKGKKRNFEIMDAIEFLHRVCLHIPDKGQVMARYYGLYANAHRGRIFSQKGQVRNIVFRGILDMSLNNHFYSILLGGLFTF